MTSTQKAEALFDFEPTAEVELKMKKGETVTVKRMSVGEGWWEGELNGRRGLFPSSFVKLLPAVAETIITTETSSSSSPITPPTPLTPHSKKKAFMDTMLAPEPSTLDEIYDEERAREIFVPGHNAVTIDVGPKWKGRPPSLTVVVKDPQTEPRFSGMKHVTFYDVDTKELDSCVTRKYKQFLWLYDRLAENFPCISLPPLPVKQGSGQGVRRKGLEKFVRKVARHPVLGCTRFLKVFLTDEDTKSDKEWKIGKHLSHFSQNIKLPKTTRKLFHAPVYCTVKYPPYNVPISQLASIEKFARFSRLLESNVNTLHMACRGVSMAQRDMTSNVNLLAKDLKCFARGMESTGGVHRRKLQAKVSVSGPSSGPLPPVSVVQQSLYSTGASSNDILGGGGDLHEESSGGEDAGESAPPQWNWRDDEKFNSMVTELLDLASRIQQTSHVFREHQETMETEVMETLHEYSGVINTFPGLVRLHEEAMEYYNNSKNKDSKKEAEEVRQNCETLNNILLSEFDYFSNHLVDDFEGMIQRFLLQQSNFHRKLADEWEELHTHYVEHISRHQSDTPIHVFSTSPTPPTSRTTSASQPHLPNIPLDTQRTPSEVLSSSGGSYTTTHSQDDVANSGRSFAPAKISQSHPNIYSIGTTSKSHTDTTDMGTRPTLTNSSESFTDTITPPTDVEAQTTSPRSYVNFDIDELRNEQSRDRRLKSLSPLELSIERELERAHGSEIEKDDAELHPYANWQFEKMNEKQQKAPSSASNTRPLLNGAAMSGRQDTATHKTPTHKSSHVSPASSSPKRSLKPPSPFKLQNLSDLTSLGTSSASSSNDQPSWMPSKITEEEPLPKSVHSGSSNALKHGKAVSTSKLHDVSSSADNTSGGLTSASSHSTRNVDQLLPSQLNLGGNGGGKPRSYTTSFSLAKKKPILPPAPVGKRVALKPHSGKKTKVVEESLDERREMLLENSNELERSYEMKSGPGSGSSVKLSSSKSFHMSGSERAVTGAAVRAARQSSPSSELMRKLSLRRQRLEQQLVTTGPGRGSGDSSSRCTSTSSTQSELVCSYNVKRSQEDEPPTGEVELRTKEDATLAKYGIMEDVEGGSYEI